jgi:hypothetical protein
MAIAGNGGEGAAGAADRRIEDGLRREMLDADERGRLKSTKPLGTRKPITCNRTREELARAPEKTKCIWNT